MIKILSPKKLNDMRKAGKIVAEALLVAEKMAKVGVTTREIDAAVEMHILKQGAKPSFKGYQGFPYTICASINEEVVHGRPSDRKLEEGDILSIDVGAVINGVHADAARTFPVGKISKNAQKLIDVTKECFFKSIENIKAGSKLNEIGKACQKHAELNGFSVVRQMVGHGIGEKLHMEPHVLNYDGYKGNGGTLLEGQTLAIEPMINEGTWQVEFRGGQNVSVVVTADGKLSAHYENTVVITKDGVEVLTI